MRGGLGSVLAVATFVVAAGAPASVARAADDRAGPVAAADVHVDVGEYFFAPGTAEVARGGTVVFDFVGAVTHTATDASGLDLYDSGNVPGGGPSFSYTFVAAGEYRFVCSPHPFMGGRVRVPVRAAPARGGRRDSFTVVWAAAAAVGNHVHDVQIRRPGERWSMWRRGRVHRSAPFVPDAGRGRYRFRARVRDVGLGESSRWSPATTIRVR
jgi:plastocyanin